MLMDVSESSGGAYKWNVTIFECVRGNTYRRHYETIQERAFEHNKVIAALRSIFHRVRGYDANGWGRPKKSSGRLFYVCKKKQLTNRCTRTLDNCLLSLSLQSAIIKRR